MISNSEFRQRVKEKVELAQGALGEKVKILP
jgi:hypothetical protein